MFWGFVGGAALLVGIVTTAGFLLAFVPSRLA